MRRSTDSSDASYDIPVPGSSALSNSEEAEWAGRGSGRGIGYGGHCRAGGSRLAALMDELRCGGQDF